MNFLGVWDVLAPLGFEWNADKIQWVNAKAKMTITPHTYLVANRCEWCLKIELIRWRALRGVWNFTLDKPSNSVMGWVTTYSTVSSLGDLRRNLEAIEGDKADLYLETFL